MKCYFAGWNSWRGVRVYVRLSYFGDERAGGGIVLRIGFRYLEEVLFNISYFFACFINLLEQFIDFLLVFVVITVEFKDVVAGDLLLAEATVQI